MRNRLFSSFILFFGFLATAFAQTQLLQNGDFTGSSYAPWVLTGSAGIVVNNGLSLGNVAGASQGVYQTVTLPANLIQATLSLDYAVVSTDTSATDDNLQVEITDTNQPNPDVLMVLGRLSNTSPTPAGEYSVFTANFVKYPGGGTVSQYAGQTVNVYFYASTDPTYGGETSFDIGDVSFVAGTTANIPGNDNFANATVIPTAGVTTRESTIYASKEAGEPNIAGNAGGRSVWWTYTATSIGVVHANTDASGFTTLLGIYTGTSVSALTQVTASDGVTNSGGQAAVTFDTVPGRQYYIALDGYNAEAGTAVLNMRFTDDKTPPTIAFTSPAGGADVTTSNVTVRGVAHDNVAVASVLYRLENPAGTNAYQLATGTNSWSAIITNLVPGPNTVRVEAIDTSSNVSAAVARTFNYIIHIPIGLGTNGDGRIVGATNGEMLGLGYKYVLTAVPTPGKGYVFSNWTDNAGSVVTNGPVLRFTMESNLVFSANFVPNPFALAGGAYRGLFYNSNTVTPASSGYVTAQVTDTGILAGRLFQGSRSYPFTGKFSLAGGFTNTFKTWDDTVLSWQLDVHGGNLLTGELVNSNWTADLTADRLVYTRTNEAPAAGRYTLVLPGTNSTTLPDGNGFGAVVVSPLGVLTFGGTLGDGTKAAQSTFVSAQDQWPFYASLYNGDGMILGWLTFTNEPDRDVDGVLTWFKPAQPRTTRYPDGFTNYDVIVIGSKYSYTNRVPVLNLADGTVILENGDLPEAITNQFVLASDNIVTGSNRLSLRIGPASGLFVGTTTNLNGRILSFSGAVLQKQTNGFGEFLGTNQTGSVLLQ
jgi:hypothetical protein